MKPSPKPIDIEIRNGNGKVCLLHPGPYPTPVTFCFWDERHPMNNTPEDEESLILDTTVHRMDEVLESERFMGGGIGFGAIGEADDRLLWLNFRWSFADAPVPDRRRTMMMGNAIEKDIAATLAKIQGLEFLDRDPNTGKQFKHQFLGGHFAGKMDGVGLGFPEAPKTWHVVEIKGVSHKAFLEAIKRGVENWRPEYWVNVQCHMGAAGLDRTLFIVQDRDTGAVHAERIKLDDTVFGACLARAERIVLAEEPPAPMYETRSRVPHDIMAFKPEYDTHIYWGVELPRPHCRNCRFAIPLVEGTSGDWLCQIDSTSSATGARLDYSQQRAGCPRHNYLPSLLSELAEAVRQYPDCVEYRVGRTVFWNAEEMAGEAHPGVFSSKELCALSGNVAANGLCEESIKARSGLAGVKQVTYTIEGEMVIVDEPKSGAGGVDDYDDDDIPF